MGSGVGLALAVISPLGHNPSSTTDSGSTAAPNGTWLGSGSGVGFGARVRVGFRVGVGVGVRGGFGLGLGLASPQGHLAQRHPVDGDDAVALGHLRHLVGPSHLGDDTRGLVDRKGEAVVAQRDLVRVRVRVRVRLGRVKVRARVRSPGATRPRMTRQRAKGYCSSHSSGTPMSKATRVRPARATQTNGLRKDGANESVVACPGAKRAHWESQPAEA